MGKVNLKFGQRGSSVAEYLQLLHQIELVDDIKSNTLLCHRDDPIFTVQKGNLSIFDHIIVEDWFGIDDDHNDKIHLFDYPNVTFCTTNMQKNNLKHASTVHYNFMFNRTKLVYNEQFPIRRNNKKFFLLLTNSTGENYKKVKYNADRAYDFLFLNARRQTTERLQTQQVLHGLNGIVSTKNNLLPGDVNMPYNPVPAEHWESCYFNIAIESNIKNDDIVHTTEKVWEPIIKYQIPIILSTEHYQTYMESLGFVFPIKVFTEPDEYYNFLTEFFSGNPRKFFLSHEDEVLHNHNLFFDLPVDTGVEQIWAK